MPFGALWCLRLFVPMLIVLLVLTLYRRASTSMLHYCLLIWLSVRLLVYQSSKGHDNILGFHSIWFKISWNQLCSNFLSKTLLSRNFCQKSVKEQFRKFHIHTVCKWHSGEIKIYQSDEFFVKSKSHDNFQF